jgi:hypothetical protein
MADLQAVVVETPTLAADEWWQEIERVLPEAFQPMLTILADVAPRRTGKLASSGFNLRMRPHDQGLIHGVDVWVGSGEPYAHLVTEGHEIIPRGPGRGGRMTRAARAALRTNLKTRRAAGSQGFVPGNPFVEQTFAEQRGAIVERIERALEMTFGR